MTELLADRNVLAERLIRAVIEAQSHDAEDERRLPLTRDEPAVVRRRTRKKLQYWARGYIR